MDRVLRILEADWQDPLRCTNVEQAIHRAGQRFCDADRRRLALAILQDSRLSDLLRWHPSAYFLTNSERRVARGVLRALEGGRTMEEASLVRQVAALLGEARESVAAAVDALRWVGFLEGEEDAVRLSPRSSEFLEGVGFYFHEVDAGEERFNVNCFHDFVLLTSPVYRARRLQIVGRRADTPGMTPKMLRFLEGIAPQELVRRSYDRGRVWLNDACASCARRIRLVVEDACLVAVQPVGAWHVRGGGCGVNNLFCDQACAEKWMAAHPGLRDAERGPVQGLWSPAPRGG
jgi:hypothetical protein